MSWRAFLLGVLFAIGLGISGMTLPTKVIGFLDLFGDWDPSLALVMVGAIGVNGLVYAVVKKRSAPLLAPRFRLPTRTDIDGRLVGGAVLFGTGWGLGGFCPGPGVVSAASGATSSLVFVAAMVVGMLAWKLVDRLLSTRVPAGATR